MSTTVKMISIRDKMSPITRINKDAHGNRRKSEGSKTIPLQMWENCFDATATDKRAVQCDNFYQKQEDKLSHTKSVRIFPPLINDILWKKLPLKYPYGVAESLIISDWSILKQAKFWQITKSLVHSMRQLFAQFVFVARTFVWKQSYTPTPNAWE